MDKDYEVVGEFVCCGKAMIIVKINSNVHVMSNKEWRWVFGQLMPERWKDGVRIKEDKKLA